MNCVRLRSDQRAGAALIYGVDEMRERIGASILGAGSPHRSLFDDFVSGTGSRSCPLRTCSLSRRVLRRWKQLGPVFFVSTQTAYGRVKSPGQGGVPVLLSLQREVRYSILRRRVRSPRVSAFADPVPLPHMFPAVVVPRPSCFYRRRRLPRRWHSGNGFLAAARCGAGSAVSSREVSGCGRGSSWAYNCRKFVAIRVGWSVADWTESPLLRGYSIRSIGVAVSDVCIECVPYIQGSSPPPPLVATTIRRQLVIRCLDDSTSSRIAARAGAWRSAGWLRWWRLVVCGVAEVRPILEMSEDRPYWVAMLLTSIDLYGVCSGSYIEPSSPVFCRTSCLERVSRRTDSFTMCRVWLCCMMSGRGRCSVAASGA